jgi:hypothetical protein
VLAILLLLSFLMLLSFLVLFVCLLLQALELWLSCLLLHVVGITAVACVTAFVIPAVAGAPHSGCTYC